MPRVAGPSRHRGSGLHHAPGGRTVSESEAVVKVTYWVAPIVGDRPNFSIRERTKKACEAKRRALGVNGYLRPRKIEVHYTDAFDLVCQCLQGLGEDVE